jgi:hypothetical protein
MGALFSFLGGSVFRMIWGEISSFVNKRQEHEIELATLRLQAELEDKRHQNTLESLRVQSELGIKMAEVQKEITIEQGESDAFVEAMKGAFKPTGYTLVDVWNGVIRPAAATIVLCLWSAKLAGQGFKMDSYDMEISGVVLGFFFADRGLSKRGK